MNDLYTIKEFDFTLRLSRLDFVSKIDSDKWAFGIHELQISVGGVTHIFTSKDRADIDDNGDCVIIDPKGFEQLTTVRKELLAAWTRWTRLEVLK